jgi:hypothetical protein
MPGDRVAGDVDPAADPHVAALLDVVQEPVPSIYSVRLVGVDFRPA